ncbi:hypothetical protein GPECTOR_40g610 [Gonium pectorale]|uniref:Peptidase S8/S53 domain-containing protein n=1 Tax=Gonium pectorale TaxID=33097 RepID=A0A150GAK1_GONPE|nr:hypothetical protein GPECTOR_40g610 [Gonium pectorale]|eukprot:KXZ46876.1 hypothetical protein GPECTOR_40g610 [Gonium pectorale]
MQYQHRTVICLAVSLGVFAVIAVVVPPVCMLKGCSTTSPAPPEKESINRLIVNFDTLGKTVKSIVPPLLYDYISEQLLTSSGIQVVTFPDAVVLEQVRQLILTQPDLANLLQDQKLAAPPVNDAILNGIGAADGGGSGSGAGSSPSRRLGADVEGRLLQAAATGVNNEETLWQRPVVDYTGAWEITEGVPSVVVAVVDTGCDLNHPDLKPSLWTNPGEIGGNNIDDDGNGYVDDVYGYDFAGNCGNDWRSSNTAGCGALPNPQDPRGHGTHCA